jgi:hypothetical protein
MKFKAILSKAAKDSDNKIIRHSGTEESALAIGTIFKHAENYVKLYVGDFCGEISNHPYYLEHLSEYLEAGKPLDAIVRNLSEAPSKVFNKISLYSGFRDDVRYEQIDHDILFDGKKIHFIVADDKMYRLEINTKDYIGVVNFNDEVVAKRLINKFNEELSKVIHG